MAFYGPSVLFLGQKDTQTKTKQKKQNMDIMKAAKLK